LKGKGKGNEGLKGRKRQEGVSGINGDIERRGKGFGGFIFLQNIKPFLFGKLKNCVGEDLGKSI